MNEPRAPAVTASHSDPDPGPHLAWLAEGVRHQVLLRALRAQRHDVLSPLSAARMILATLKRRLLGTSPDLPSAAAQAETLSVQLADAVSAVALMRVWDATLPAAQPLPLLLKACADLLRTDASLRGHRLVQLDLPAPESAPPLVAVPDAHYAVLAWLMHHLDASTQGSEFKLGLLPDGVQLQRVALSATTSAVPSLPDPQPRETARRVIDARALKGLLDEVGWCQTATAVDTWVLHTPTR